MPHEITPPRGMYPGRLDDKGRLKLPAGFQEYFKRVGADRVFVTSLDRRTARIYTLAAWQSETSAANHDDRISETMRFHADDLGAESDIDWQGRILIPWKLRQELGIENSEVYLYFYGSHLEALSEAVYAERRQRAADLREPDSLR